MLWTILIGFLVGLVARALMPGKDSLGFILTILLGIAGSWMGNTLAGRQVGFIGSVLGAIVVLLIYRFLKKK